ncbi:MAG TPA: hypothetical protein VD906_10685 [Caulobacteraceae bacterium]|nr:hypothetical protein [Caulobacteraceae bacterium]
MSPALLLALSLISVDTAAAGGQVPAGAGFASAPTDDYGYVGWCYGAVAGYVDHYEKAMPEVERIERAFPTPSTEENIKIVYPGQRANAREQLKLFRSAMTAAEKASPTPIQTEGAAAIAKGRAVWAASTLVTPAKLGQFWMSWTPPSECEKRAKSLEAKASLLGQALKFNAEEAPAPAPAETVAEAAPAEAAPAATEVSAMSAEPELIRASTGTAPDPVQALIDAQDAYLTAGEVQALSGGDEPVDPGLVDVDVGP